MNKHPGSYGLRAKGVLLYEIRAIKTIRECNRIS